MMVQYFLSVDLANGRPTKTLLTDEKYVKLAVEKVLGACFASDDYYLVYQGRRVREEDEVVGEGWYHVVPRLSGGKGGFGSMLRALGAQIEKTTNREACRDLSGRRMRDVNNEKKLREWAAKSVDREKEKQERRRQKRERTLAPKKFREEDKEYEMQRQKIADDLDDAFQQGMKKAVTSASSSGACSSSFASSSCANSLKRKSPPTCTETSSKKSKLWSDIGEMDSSSNDESETVEQLQNKVDKETEDISNDTVNEVDPQPTELPEENTNKAPEKSDDNNQQDNSVELLGQSLNLDLYESAEALGQLGLEVLKAALTARGMKCGGTLKERADRLFSVKGLEVDQIPSNLLAKPVKKK